MSELTTNLSELARKINQCHQQVTQAAQSAVLHAKEGGYLIQAKAKVGHGKWLRWLAANCKLSARTVELYMRVARCAHELDVNNPNLSLRDAIQVLTTSRQIEEAPQAKPIEVQVVVQDPPKGRAHANLSLRKKTLNRIRNALRFCIERDHLKVQRRLFQWMRTMLVRLS